MSTCLKPCGKQEGSQKRESRGSKIPVRTKYTIREWLIYRKSENNWKEILDKRNVKREAPFLKIKL